MLSIQEAADRLGISYWTLHRMARREEIVTVKMGSRRLIHEADLEAFMQRARATATRRVEKARRGRRGAA